MMICAGRSIRAGTTKVERHHNFAKFLCFGGKGLLRTNDPADQEKTIVYNELVANAVALQNVVDQTQALRQLQAEGISIDPRDLSFMSPYNISKSTSASDCAWVRAIAKDQRRRLDEETLAGFNQSADLSTYPKKISVRSTRATALEARVLGKVAMLPSSVRTANSNGYIFAEATSAIGKISDEAMRTVSPQYRVPE
jgi:hypothetical protein